MKIVAMSKIDYNSQTIELSSSFHGAKKLSSHVQVSTMCAVHVFKYVLDTQ